MEKEGIEKQGMGKQDMEKGAMDRQIDARGLACPQPVLLAKKALAQAAGVGVAVLVDNDTAVENLRTLGASLGYDIQAAPYAEGGQRVAFAKSAAQAAPAAAQQTDGYVVVLDGEEMGRGDAAFGKKLLEGFVYALAQQDAPPRYILCYNKGVTLTTLNEKCAADLHALAAKGTQVLSCGLCLEYYGLKEKLQVGQVTNMYRICELMGAHRVVKP